MADPSRPLERSLSRPFEPGTNLRSGAAGATLAFALPSLAVDRIAVAGTIDDATRTMLGRLAEEVVPAGHAPVDVLWVGDGATGALDDSVLAGSSAIVVEDASSSAGQALASQLTASGRSAAALQTVVVDGSIRAAAPAMAVDAGPTGRLRLPGIAVAPRGWRHLGRSSRLLDGRALLATRHDPSLAPPRWLIDLAAAAAHDIRDYGWSIAAPGVYDSQKVLVYLTPPGAAQPAWITKVTRSAGFADRLRNEADGLRSIAALEPIDGLVVPGVVAAGDVGRLVAVIETVVPGRPFTGRLDRSRAAAVGPVIDVFGRLGAASAHGAPPSDVAAALQRLLDAYVATFAPAEPARARLAALVDRVERSPDPIPLVAQHGDPHIGNVLVTDDGRIGLLDWESFDPDGLPLWDAFHFLLGAVVRLGRSWVPRRRLSIAARNLVDVGPLTDLFLDSVAAYRAHLAVAPELLETLFAFCWIHRALKESTRRRPDDVSGGFFARFADLVIAAPSAPTLRRLAGGASRQSATKS